MEFHIFLIVTGTISVLFFVSAAINYRNQREKTKGPPVVFIPKDSIKPEDVKKIALALREQSTISLPSYSFVHCASCRFLNPPEANFCRRCGKTTERTAKRKSEMFAAMHRAQEQFERANSEFEKLSK